MNTQITKEEFLSALQSDGGAEFVGTYGSRETADSIMDNIKQLDSLNCDDRVTSVDNDMIRTECAAICLDTDGAYSFNSVENSTGIHFLVMELKTRIFYDVTKEFTRYFVFATPGEKSQEQVKNTATDLFNRMLEMLPKNPTTVLDDHYINGTIGIWASLDEILCPSEEDLNTIVKIFDSVIKDTDGDELIFTGYYDPEEDKRMGEVDRYTGYWYVYLE